MSWFEHFCVSNQNVKCTSYRLYQMINGKICYLITYVEMIPALQTWNLLMLVYIHPQLRVLKIKIKFFMKKQCSGKYVLFFFFPSIFFIQGFLIIHKFMVLLKMTKIPCETSLRNTTKPKYKNNWKCATAETAILGTLSIKDIISFSKDV